MVVGALLNCLMVEIIGLMRLSRFKTAVSRGFDADACLHHCRRPSQLQVDRSAATCYFYVSFCTTRIQGQINSHCVDVTL